MGSVLGWIGTVGTFTAYVLMLRGSWLPTTKRYLWFNTVGGLFAMGSAIAFGAWPSVVSNLVWAAMGLYGLIDLMRRGAVRATEPAAIAPAAAVEAAAEGAGSPAAPAAGSPKWAEPATAAVAAAPAAAWTAEMPEWWDPSNTAASSISLPWLPQAAAQPS